ncbi:MAG TPA: IclR family transcriptional regulator [Ornithinimicrobium sp.]|uniref:IclR family transcriptional regulator n=1 Tax=Ornithinimicrobium sp. TaxID=1977084 RepID=UPI002B46C78A|nr:IclR family transcriptional regulator [Ornithinimicrobium sp.]HKJ11892.1 IclR family transcriptional regulator [Ornithinimicrobium sp.]
MTAGAPGLASPTSPGAGTQAVDRAARLIDLVIHSDRPLTTSELAEATGLARSTASRLLSALERTELLERTVDGYVGGQLFALYAALHDPWPQVARLAEPVLQSVSAACGETVHLGVARSDNVFYIAQVESTYLLRARDWNEVEVPVHCSSLGKVLCAFGAIKVPPGRLEKLTEETRTREQLVRELGEVRARGYSVSCDELEVGLSGLAAPVAGLEGSVIASLGVSGPTVRLQEQIPQLGRLLADEGARLASLLQAPAQARGVA